VRAAPTVSHGALPEAEGAGQGQGQGQQHSVGMLVVESVVPGSAADGVLEPGDVLVRVGGQVSGFSFRLCVAVSMVRLPLVACCTQAHRHAPPPPPPAGRDPLSAAGGGARRRSGRQRGAVAGARRAAHRWVVGRFGGPNFLLVSA
jgi:hypothetical protein